jgi:hypothetical protein
MVNTYQLSRTSPPNRQPNGSFGVGEPPGRELSQESLSNVTLVVDRIRQLRGNSSISGDERGFVIGMIKLVISVAGGVCSMGYRGGFVSLGAISRHSMGQGHRRTGSGEGCGQSADLDLLRMTGYCLAGRGSASSERW